MGRLAALLIFAFAAPVAPAMASDLSSSFVKSGLSALDKKDFKQANKFCQQAMVADPKDPAGFTCLGRTYEKAKKGKQADRYYKLALVRAPNDERALSWAGLRDLAKGRPDKARTKLEKLEKACGGCAGAKELRRAYTKYKAKKNASR